MGLSGPKAKKDALIAAYQPAYICHNDKEPTNGELNLEGVRMRMELVLDGRIFLNFLLLGAALLCGGCAAHANKRDGDYNRLALAQPPAFDPQMLSEAEREPITTLAMDTETEPAMIEPAAGAAVHYMDDALPALPACKFGTNIAAGEAFSYAWPDARIGLGFGGSSVRSSEIGGALLRFSISLDRPKARKASCDHGAAWKEFTQEFSHDFFE